MSQDALFFVGFGFGLVFGLCVAILLLLITVRDKQVDAERKTPPNEP